MPAPVCVLKLKNTNFSLFIISLRIKKTKVEACIEYDTDYIDVNGEIPFTHKIVEYHDWAKMNDVLIVPNCAGAGGVPDVGAFYTFRKLQERIAAQEMKGADKNEDDESSKNKENNDNIKEDLAKAASRVECAIDKMHMYLCGSGGGIPSGGTLATRAAMNSAMRDVA